MEANELTRVLVKFCHDHKIKVRTASRRTIPRQPGRPRFMVPMGVYDASTQVITLRQDLPPEEAAVTLLHELLHACYGDKVTERQVEMGARKIAERLGVKEKHVRPRVHHQRRHHAQRGRQDPLRQARGAPREPD